MKNALDMIFPKETKFFSFLHEQAENNLLIHKRFTELLEGYSRFSAAEKQRYVQKIKELEGFGDKIQSLIFEELRNSFVTPINREDIHRLAMRSDDVADGIYRMAKRLVFFRVRTIPKPFFQVNKTIGQELDLLQQIMHSLDKKGNDIELLCVKVQSLENEAEKQVDLGLAKLLSGRFTVETIKLDDLYDTMKQISTNAEEVTYTLQNIEVKHG